MESSERPDASSGSLLFKRLPDVPISQSISFVFLLFLALHREQLLAGLLIYFSAVGADRPPMSDGERRARSEDLCSNPCLVPPDHRDAQKAFQVSTADQCVRLICC